jgi:uncharacterized membrane protein
MPAQDLHARLDEFAFELRDMERRLDSLRRLVDAQVAPEPAIPTPPPRAVAPPLPPAPAPTRRARRELDIGALFGARSLAWSGGIVTLLGVVFFFTLAEGRSWIGPIERVSLGALASLIVFAFGLFLHRRYGDTYAALTAVGAGIAGGYATLLFAAARYELIPDLAALGIAAVIAAIGTATALAWAAQTVAAMGLIGAMLVPTATVLDEPHELTVLGTAFAAIVLAATAIVAIHRRWLPLLAIAGLVGLVQISGLVAQTEGTPATVVAVAAVYWLLALAIAAALQRLAPDSLDRLPAAFVTAGTAMAGLSTARLFEGTWGGADAEGIVLGVIAVVELTAGAVLYGRRVARELGTLLVVAGLTVGAAAFSDLFSNATLATAWAGEAVVLAWLAPRVRDARLQLVSLAFLSAATVHALAIDAPARQLYEANADPSSGVLAVVAAAAAWIVFAAYGRPWPFEPLRSRGVLAFLDEPANLLAREHRVRRVAAAWSAGALALYAAALAILALFQAWTDWSVDDAFDWGHVAVRSFWVATAVVLIAASALGWRRHLTWAGHTLLVVALLHVPRHDVDFLAATQRSWVFLVMATGLVSALVLDELRGEAGRLMRRLPPVFAPASLALVVAAVLELVETPQDARLLVLAVTGVYALLAALLFHAGRREVSTALWAPALAVAVWAASELLDGTWLVLALSGAAVVTVALASIVGERRLQLASGVLLVLSFAHVITVDAPLSDFFSANANPAAGVPALACLAVAAAIFALVRFNPPPDEEPTFAPDRIAWELDRRQPQWRAIAGVGSGLLALYALSLTILGAFQWVDEASVATSFQRGHTAVSAFWGIVGLLTLLVGLVKQLPAFRVAGFALFGVSLAKLFLYDLSELSSVTRAFSFLAVGAVLLIGGFLYQRLEPGSRRGAPQTG